MWIYASPAQREAMPVYFQEEMQRVEDAGMQSKPPRSLKDDYEQHLPNPKNAQGPDWVLWRMINHPERDNKPRNFLQHLKDHLAPK